MSGRRQLSACRILTGMGIGGGIFAVLASVFPSEHRGTGIGLVIGVG